MKELSPEQIQELTPTKCPLFKSKKIHCDKTNNQSCWDRRCPYLFKNLNERDAK